MNPKKYEYFVLDLIKLLKEQLETVCNEQNPALSSEDKAFISGQIISLYSVLSLIKSQAAAFGIPLKEVELENYNLEQFLFNKAE